MATIGFLSVDGVQGSSTDAAHPGWIPILSYSQSLNMPAAAGGVGHSFSVSKAVDQTSPALYGICATGKHVSKVVVDLVRASGPTPQTYLSIEMDQVVIASINTGDTSGSSIDNLSLNSAEIRWTYKPASGTSAGQGGTTITWNPTGNQPAV